MRRRGGRVDAFIRFAAVPGWAEEPGDEAPVLVCLGREAPFEVAHVGQDVTFRASLPVSGFERWWPRTHGAQPLYEVGLRLGDGRPPTRARRVPHGRGRSVRRRLHLRRQRRADLRPGSQLVPPDPVSFRTDEQEVRRRLELARDANLNMVRIPGTTAYADRSVLDACDELGLLLWHDCMFAFLDYPDDESFVTGVRTELRQAFAELSSHPSLAIVCGNQEVGEISAMNGGSQTGPTSELFDTVIP